MQGHFLLGFKVFGHLFLGLVKEGLSVASNEDVFVELRRRLATCNHT